MRKNPRDEALHKTTPADAGGIAGDSLEVGTQGTMTAAPIYSPSKERGRWVHFLSSGLPLRVPQVSVLAHTVDSDGRGDRCVRF